MQTYGQKMVKTIAKHILLQCKITFLNMWFETTPLSHHHMHVTNPVSLPDGAFHIISISRQYLQEQHEGTGKSRHNYGYSV